MIVGGALALVLIGTAGSYWLGDGVRAMGLRFLSFGCIGVGLGQAAATLRREGVRKLSDQAVSSLEVGALAVLGGITTLVGSRETSLIALVATSALVGWMLLRSGGERGAESGRPSSDDVTGIR